MSHQASHRPDNRGLGGQLLHRDGGGGREEGPAALRHLGQGREADGQKFPHHTALRPIRPTLASPEGKQPAGLQDPNPEQHPRLLRSQDRDPAQEATVAAGRGDVAVSSWRAAALPLCQQPARRCRSPAHGCSQRPSPFQSGKEASVTTCKSLFPAFTTLEVCS